MSGNFANKQNLYNNTIHCYLQSLKGNMLKQSVILTL